MWVYFVLFISLTVYALLNLVSAVIIKTAMCLAVDEDNELDFQYFRKFRRLAKMLEQRTGKSSLCVKEYLDLSVEPAMKNLMRQYDCTAADICSICDMLADPNDPNQEVKIEHFVFGMQRLKGHSKSKDTLEVLRRLAYLEQYNRNLLHQVSLISQFLIKTHSTSSTTSSAETH